jgi:murein DD-endopeptidase MepM/ murein hydrolase activator NlpD
MLANSCRIRAILALGAAFGVHHAMPADAHRTTATGGATAPGRPEIESLRCAINAGADCAPGTFLRISGEDLERGRTVEFLGAPGAVDDRRAPVRTASAHRILVRVPSSARSGPVRVRSVGGASSPLGPSVDVAAVPASSESVSEQEPVAGSAPAGTAASTPEVFPVLGAHDFGTATNAFGGGRGHQGQDILAGCGVPVVAATGGTVVRASYESAAGNHVVVELPDGTSQVYMHMLAAASVRAGDVVATGQQIGRVGRTGRATACHLHFELWTAPGWYRGGRAVDPLPALRRWASATA